MPLTFDIFLEQKSSYLYQGFPYIKVKSYLIYMKYKSLRKIAKYISNSLMPKLPSWNTSGHKFSHTIVKSPSPKSKVPKSRPKGLGLTLKSHGFRFFMMTSG